MPTISSPSPSPSALAPGDLGPALLSFGRAIAALRVSPQTFGLDSRVDRAAYYMLSRLDDLGTARLTDLASTLGLDLSTVSRQMRALEEAGLVVRTADPDDRRASVLTPTETGHDLVMRMKAAFSQLVDSALDGWSDRDRRTLTTLLTRLAADLGPERAPQLLESARATR